MLRAMAKWKQTLFAHRGVRTGAGALDVHSCRWPRIDPHRLLVQRRFKGRPPEVIMQGAPALGGPVIGTIETLDRVSCRTAQCPKTLRHPGFDVHEPVISPGEDRAEPDRHHPAPAEALPVAMGGKGSVQQRRETPPLPLCQQQRYV